MQNKKQIRIINWTFFILLVNSSEIDLDLKKRKPEENTSNRKLDNEDIRKRVINGKCRHSSLWQHIRAYRVDVVVFR